MNPRKENQNLPSESINSRLGHTNFEDKTSDLVQTNKRNGKVTIKNEANIWEILDANKWPDICIIGMLESKETNKGIETLRKQYLKISHISRNIQIQEI